MESAGYLQYYITKEAINRFVSFKCIPMREDGLVGKEKTVVGKERIQPGSCVSTKFQIEVKFISSKS